MPNANRAITRYLLQSSSFVLCFAVGLFISSGYPNWVMGWVFITIVAATHICILIILMVTNPELMGERAEIKGKRDLDRILASIITLYG
jgi:hypothetical protein